MYAADVANPWIVVAHNARRRAPGSVVLIVAALAAAGVVAGAGRLWTAIGPGVAADPEPAGGLLSAALSNLLVFGPLVLIAILGRLAEGRSLWLAGARPVLSGGLGLLLGAGGFVASIGVASLAGVVVPGHVDAASRAPLVAATGGVALVAFQAAAEEIYFRGWLQPVLCARWGAWPGLVATALVFAGLHMVAGARSPLALANLFLGGIVFGLLALRTGGLVAPVAAHFAWNWLEACGLGLEPNPGVGQAGALVDLDLTGPRLWSGGGDDMNGSLATTVVMACLAIGLLALAPIRSAAPEARRSGSAP